MLRPRLRTKLGEVQASDAKTVTELAIGSLRKSARIEAQSKRNLNSQTQIGPTNRKMSLSTQPEKTHSVILNENSNELPPSLDGGLSDNLLNAAYCHLRHQTRDSNSVDVDRKMETKIKFPPSNDKIWKKIDEELKIIITKVFTKRQMKKLSSSELSQNFDAWLHNFFLNVSVVKKTQSFKNPRETQGQIKL